MKAPDLSFRKFLSAFPEHPLPIALTDESVMEFERENDPLSIELIDLFVEAQEGERFELIDYVPCFSVPGTLDFHAIVIWRGDLLRHEYIMVTFDKQGNQIANAIVAGMKVEGDLVLRSVATIEESWIISVAEGAQAASDLHYSPTSTSTFQLELLATGEIISLTGSEE